MRRRLQSFANNDQGAIAIIFAFTITLIGIFVGGAIDYARYTNAKTQTTAALDAAVLAGARTLLLGGSATDAESAAQNYYNKNVVDRFNVINDTVAFNVTDNDTALSGSGNAFLPTTFLKLAGIDSMPLVSQVNAKFPKAQINGGGGSNLEVSVMLDVTGSMCDDGSGPCTTGTKIYALKTAVKDLVKIVVQDDQSTYQSRVALVPFSNRIRVAPDGQGSTIMGALTDMSPTWSGWRSYCTASQYGGTTEATGGESPSGGDYYVCSATETRQQTNWKIRPCVTERFFESTNTLDATDDAPGTNAWLNAYDGDRLPISNDSASNPPTSGIGATSTDPADFWNYSASGDCSMAEENEIVPLTSDRSKLLGKIDGLEGRKTTGGALGTAFAWYMLSPKWNNIWPASPAGPYGDLTTLQSNGKPKLRKVAILMSDGVYNAQRGWTGQDQQKVSDNAKAICTAMKAAGIEIYTVGFDLDSLPSAERTIALNTLQSCGTDLEHFYNTLDPTELQSAFRDIAVKMSSVSLMQ